MDKDFVIGVAGIVAGLVMGVIITSFVWALKVNEFKAPFDAAIAKCEAELPRDQECYIEYVAKVKK